MTARRATVVGQGPAGLLTASILSQAGLRVTVVADGEGTLPLWPGTFDFVNFDAAGRAVENPWKVPTLWPGDWPEDAWRVWWAWLGRLFERIGVSYRGGAQNRWMLGASGRPKPVYLAPSWLYTTERPGPIWLVGQEGLQDSAGPVLAERYRTLTGEPARYDRLDAPPASRSFWSAIHWAGYFESDEGRSWLADALARRAQEVDPGWPLIMPAILGIDRVEAVLDGLARDLERPVGECGWVPPALGGVRLRDRWRRRLRNEGVWFVNGHVVGLDESRLRLADGRVIEGEAVILATGGLVGGGLVLDGDGRLFDSARGAEEPWGGAIEELPAAGVGLRAGGTVAVAGRQVGGDVDRYGFGGALVLYSAVEAARQVAGDRVVDGIREEGWAHEPR